MSERKFLELAARMAHRATELRGDTTRPALRIVRKAVSQPYESMDSATRESYVRLITSFRRVYGSFGIDAIIDQALLEKVCIEQLDDQELVDLLGLIDRARECIVEGIGFDEAGLLKARSQPLFLP